MSENQNLINNAPTPPLPGSAQSQDRKLDIMSVLHLSSEFIKTHFHILAVLTFVFFIANILPAFTSLLSGGIPEVALGIVQGILTLIAAIVNIVTVVALMDTVAENGMPVGGLSGAYKRGAALIWSYFLVVFLISLVTWGGFLLLIIPGIIMSFMLALSPYIVFAENKKGTDALAYSWYYVKGYGWQIFWFLFIVGVLVAALVGGIIIIFTGVLHMSKGSIGETVLTTAITSIIEPILVVYMFQIYKRLKDIKGEPSAEDVNKRKTKLRILAALGVLAIILFVGITFFLIFMSAKYSQKTPQATTQTFDQSNNAFSIR